MSEFKKYMSFILPIKLEGDIGENGIPLDVYYDNGKIKLFTKNTNYSGGKLKSMFKKALKHMDFKPEDTILVLGFGMGSVWEIIKFNKKQNPTIIGVDNEPLMLGYIKKYSPYILSDSKTKFVIKDAFFYIDNCKHVFSYIIIDLFFDDQVANVVNDPQFVTRLKALCNDKTRVVLNTMNMSLENLDIYRKHFVVVDIQRIERVNMVFYLKLKDINSEGLSL